MGIYDVLLVVSWLLLAVIIAIAGCVLLGADVRAIWLRSRRRDLPRSRT